VDNSIHSLPFQQIQGTNLSLTCPCRNTWRGVQKLLEDRTKRGILPFPKLLDSSTISTPSSSCTWAAAPFLLHTKNQAAGQHGHHFPQAWIAWAALPPSLDSTCWTAWTAALHSFPATNHVQQHSPSTKSQPTGQQLGQHLQLLDNTWTATTLCST
jgi:hypothetical protein